MLTQMTVPPEPYWSVPEADLLQQLRATRQGLTAAEVRQRLSLAGASALRPRQRAHEITLLLAQFKSPLILILLAAAGLSFFLHDPADALIILTIVLVSGVLGFWQERGAAQALAKLLATVQTKAVVLRDGTQAAVPVDDVVPGDVVILSAGATIRSEEHTSELQSR